MGQEIRQPDGSELKSQSINKCKDKTNSSSSNRLSLQPSWIPAASNDKDESFPAEIMGRRQRLGRRQRCQTVRLSDLIDTRCMKFVTKEINLKIEKKVIWIFAMRAELGQD